MPIVNAFTCTRAYAVLIMSGLMRVENRSCLPVPARGRCAMSVSKKFCRAEYDGVRRCSMRKLALLFLVMVTAFISSARIINISTQPASPYADTEVSTNVVLKTGRSDVREVKLHLQLEGTPTNDLEVAFGCDVNTNGVLDVSEVETVYGWRGGRYFIENVRAWERFETEAAVSAMYGVIDVQLKNDRNYTPALFTATCGVERAFIEFETNPPAWLFRRGWNMMRVVRRGTGVPSEWVSCTVNHEFFYIHLK